MPLRFDLHNHTRESDEPPDHWFPRWMGSQECHIRPHDSYYQATRVRGLDGMAITNHNSVEDALRMQALHPETVIAGCEYTVGGGEGYTIHVVVLDLDGPLHERFSRTRHQGLGPFMREVREADRPAFLAHVAWDYLCTKELTPAVVESWLAPFDLIETRNSTRMLENTFAAKLARYYGKVGVGGSDGHNLDQIGRAWTESPTARTKREFLDDLKAGRVRAGGEYGSVRRFEATIRDLIRGFYRKEIEKVRSAESLGEYLARARLQDLLRNAVEIFILPHLLWLPRTGSIRHMREMQQTAIRLEREFLDYLLARETDRILRSDATPAARREEWSRAVRRIHEAFEPAGEEEIEMDHLHLPS
ncbi:MAG: PHP domain-containing protein [Planctomycetes bacterium]|nr:PHP domain-containing protein [Planctomycetota bacterium]